MRTLLCIVSKNNEVQRHSFFYTRLSRGLCYHDITTSYIWKLLRLLLCCSVVYYFVQGSDLDLRSLTILLLRDDPFSFSIIMSRPELTGHAAHFYNEKEARKYDSSSRMVGVQREITERAIELLRLDNNQPSLVLDIGCGSGLSGQVLEEKGHVWVGCDVSRDMLNVAQERMQEQSKDNNDNKKNTMHDDDESDDDDDEDGPSTGDLLHHDMGTGLPFRPATFDACISISALQWLCYSNSAQQNPKRRLTRFFSSLYQVLKRGGRAVLQFYPETAEQG